MEEEKKKELENKSGLIPAGLLWRLEEQKVSACGYKYFNFLCKNAIIQETNCPKVRNKFVWDKKGLGWSKNTVIKAKRELIEKGFISVKDDKDPYVKIIGFPNPKFYKIKKSIKFEQITVLGKQTLESARKGTFIKHEGSQNVIRDFSIFTEFNLEKPEHYDFFARLELVIVTMKKAKDLKVKRYLKVWNYFI